MKSKYLNDKTYPCIYLVIGMGEKPTERCANFAFIWTFDI